MDYHIDDIKSLLGSHHIVQNSQNILPSQDKCSLAATRSCFIPA